MGHFRAMANPCLIIIEHENVSQHSDAIKQNIRLMAKEVWRIEQNYSRYLASSVLSKINDANGVEVSIDQETYQLLNVADILWQESEGMFDISSGAFRKIWKFKDQQTIPSQKQIDNALTHVGWNRVQFNEHKVCLEPGMQIDFGGIGKEYAADKCAALADKTFGNSVLVNLGGDVVAKGPRLSGKPWDVGIEIKDGGGKVWKNVPLAQGAIATSGDVYKSIVVDGKRYSHIINAITGYPTPDAPNTVSVIAPNCTEAGMLSTIAILKGLDAKTFLEEQGRPYWIQR
ncbi:MAG: FAD:protein FMN transferase [Cocleimonas sp.]